MVSSSISRSNSSRDSGMKVLYKYKNKPLEFHDGKVADVR
jgi:hypothetical protein